LSSLKEYDQAVLDKVNDDFVRIIRKKGDDGEIFGFESLLAICEKHW